MKKKRDALKAKFQALLKEIVVCKKEVGVMMNECAFTLAKAEYASETEIASGVLSRVSKPAITVKMGASNVAGVQLPVFQMQRDAAKEAGIESLGIGCGGQTIQTARDQHVVALELLIKMASLQTSFKTLDEEIKMTSRRVNALQYVVIPRLDDVQQWIKGEMDEMEREEFFRVKKVVEKKKARLELEKLRMMEEEGDPFANVSSPATALPARDEDLLF